LRLGIKEIIVVVMGMALILLAGLYISQYFPSH
jgi:hypothetical protein